MIHFNYIYLALILPIIALLISIISNSVSFFNKSKRYLLMEVLMKNVHPFRDLPTKDLFYFYYLADMAGLMNSNKSRYFIGLSVKIS